MGELQGYDAGADAASQEDALVQRTLVALNEMRIKFPGKTDEEAEYILDKVLVATRRPSTSSTRYV